MRIPLTLSLVITACSAPTPVTQLPDGGVTIGETHSGSYHLGPVDWQESQWNNSCSPYPSAVQQLEGTYLAGVDNSLNGDGSLCDACALVTTRLGKSLLVRIVTTGSSNSAGDMDLSQAAYDFLHEDDPQGTSQNPRPMTWHLASCQTTETIRLQYQTEANAYWTSLWVRNPKQPVAKVEVKRSTQSGFTALTRGSDGTFTLNSGFGDGAFTLKITSVDGQSLTQDFSGFAPGALVEAMVQFE